MKRVLPEWVGLALAMRQCQQPETYSCNAGGARRAMGKMWRA